MATKVATGAGGTCRSRGLLVHSWQARKDAGDPADDAPIFVNARAEPLTRTAAYRAVKAAGKKAGVLWAGLRELRHSCATILFKRGLNAVQVQLWLGHHSPAFTLATYVHLLPDDLPEPTFFDAIGAASGADEGEDHADAASRAV